MAAWDLYEGSPSKWMFVIDTEDYAGGVERELSSYIVGRCDEYGDHMGGPYQELYNIQLPEDPFKDLVGSLVDDHGDDSIHRSPMTLVPTPGYSNDKGVISKLRPGQKMKFAAFCSVGIALRREPTDEEFKLMTERALDFPAPDGTQVGFSTQHHRDSTGKVCHGHPGDEGRVDGLLKHGLLEISW